jgi:hypothetical protein
MDAMMMSWSFGDPIGWAIAFGFFGLFSVGIGWLVYALSRRLFSVESLEHGPSAGWRISVALGSLLALGIFSAFYFTSLSGFSRLEFRHDQLTVRYILPERTVALPFIKVLSVQEEPAFKGRWRLVLITDTHEVYESMLASQTDVHQAAEVLRQQMGRPYSLYR